MTGGLPQALFTMLLAIVPVHNQSVAMRFVRPSLFPANVNGRSICCVSCES